MVKGDPSEIFQEYETLPVCRRKTGKLLEDRWPGFASEGVCRPGQQASKPPAGAEEPLRRNLRTDLMALVQQEMQDGALGVGGAFQLLAASRKVLAFTCFRQGKGKGLFFLRLFATCFFGIKTLKQEQNEVCCISFLSVVFERSSIFSKGRLAFIVLKPAQVMIVHMLTGRSKRKGIDEKR